MRKFRSDRVNLSDPRIAYTLLLTISLVCTVMGLSASRAERQLTAWQLENCCGTLLECADSLNAWSDAAADDDKIAAALRFRNAVAALPQEAPRQSLMAMADAMREGDDAAAQNARTLSDTFALLAAFDYPDSDTARVMIAGALEDVSDRLLPMEAEESADAPAAEQQPDTAWYSRDIAEQTAAAMFGSRTACEASADGSAWIAEAENLRMRFSAFDGSLESFVYIRLGDSPDIICTEGELLEQLTVFAEDKLRLGTVTETAVTDSLGGFRAVSFICRGEEYRAVLDQAGRVWSMAKVKR